MTLKSSALAQGLLAAVRQQQLHLSPDALLNGVPMRQAPSLDLAVIAFTAQGPVGANVLFSREHPEGHIADPSPGFGTVQGLRFDADLQGSDGVSIAWRPDADWRSLPFRPLWGDGPLRFVAPYPASLLKVMVAVGVARCVDAGQCAWDHAWLFDHRTRPLRDWQFDMLAVSCNTATSAMVALLHRCGALSMAAGGTHALHGLFEQLGLPTLRLANTQPDGGWGNAAGAGVGHIQMTAWDTVRLLWWLDPNAPPCPWLCTDAPRLSESSRAEVLRGLGEQGLDIVLSSGALAGLPDWVAGVPAQVQPGWLQADGQWAAGEYAFPPAQHHQTEAVHFAHKIGNTENYTADAGIVTGLGPHRRRYLIALLSNLGSRYAPHPLAACPWGIPALGAAIDHMLAANLE